VAQFARVPASHPRAGDAAYERARALLRDGKLAASRTALRQVPARFPGSDAAARALYLLADLATDEGRDAAARSAFRSLAADHPRSPLASRARFNAAIIAFASGEHATAARELDTLRTRDPKGEHAAAATYWSGRAWQRAGRPELAQERWRSLLPGSGPSYYATMAAHRLNTAGWAPAAAPVAPPRLADVDSAMQRAATLEATGMDLEARLEYDALARKAGNDPARLLATAAALQRQGRSSRGITLAARALARGAPADAATYRLLYPVLHVDVLEAEARERRLDPALVAALVRQESNFEPSAHSPAGARGLMQLMPPVGRSIARSLDFPVWDTALLFEPDVSLRLGSAHLASLVRQYDALPHVLAAYNAGGSRVARWRTKGGVADDPELFTERIPYEETRDYVRIVLRNREIYGALYRWPSPAADGAQQPAGSPLR
jgi:soluble lytic murein transglycosylase